ncbi:MAG: argininosuccinate lyase [Actinomycetota bacterium]
MARGGRFARPPADAAWRLVRSLDFDVRLAPHDVRVSKAHAAALAAAGLISFEERDLLDRALDEIGGAISEGRFEFVKADEDIHMAIERGLTDRLGPVGAKIHAGRSRNDQVVADLRLFVKDACADVGAAVRRLVGALVDQAESHKDVLLPGYTHLQRAQPVLLAHHLLAHAWALVRDESRFSLVFESADISPLGAAALAGTTLPLGSDKIARNLGFARVFENSMDAVADRDFALEFLAAGVILGVHLSWLAEEIVLWSTAEFGYAEVDEAYATGSSIMPQKRNPDAAELSRAKAGRLLGNFVTLAAALKALPFAYNRDLQEDKEPVFDTADTLRATLPALAGVVETLHFNDDRLAAAASDPGMFATDIAEHLTTRGMPFREAHALVGRMVKDAEAGEKTLAELISEEGIEQSALLADLPKLDAREAVSRRTGPGATSPGSVEGQIAQLRDWLSTRSAH